MQHVCTRVKGYLESGRMPISLANWTWTTTQYRNVTKVDSKWLYRERHHFFPHKRPKSGRNSFSLANGLTICGLDLMPVGKSDVFRDRAILSPL